MQTCPIDGTPLASVSTPRGVHWQCGACGGRAISLAVVRRMIDNPLVSRIWTASARPDAPPRHACPACRAPMAVVHVDGREFDVCRRCHLLWLAAGADADLPAAKPVEARGPEPRRRFNLPLRPAPAFSAPDTAGGWLAGALGLPVETLAPRTTPWATWLTAFVVALVSIPALASIDVAAASLGFVPVQWHRAGGLTLLTSFFLHADLLHLLGNLYFLVVFGDNVEDQTGPLRFLLLLLAATALGGLTHALVASDPTLPAIGASGGISGVIVFYALRFPGAPIRLLWVGVWSLVGVRWIELPAFVALVLWIGYQFVGLASRDGAIAWGAHIGGAAAGAILFVLWRPRRTGPTFADRLLEHADARRPLE